MMGIDLIRVFSVLMIFLFHSNIHVCNITYGIFTSFICMGAMTMTAFYMISGFALYHVYRNRDYCNITEIRKFYLKRIFGIIPAYYIVCIIFDVYKNDTITLKHLLAMIPMDILGIQSWFSGTFKYGHVSGTWFISCILLSYFMFPLLVTIIKQIMLKEKICLYMLLTVILLYAPLARHALELPSIYANPLFRMLEFTLGMLLYAIAIDNGLEKTKIVTRLRNWYVIAVEFIVLVACVTLAVNFKIAVGNYMLYSWIGIPLYTLMFISLSGKNISNSLEKIKILPFATGISYTFFLAQFFLWDNTMKLSNLSGMDSNVTRFLISFTLCSFIAIALHKGIEVPCKRLLTGKFLK